MSRNRILARLAQAGTGLAIATLVTVGVATPAFAEDPVDVNLGGLSSSLFAGGPRDGFTVTLRNRTNQAFLGVHRAFVVRLPGLEAGGVRIFKTFGQELPQQVTGPGEIRLTDPQEVELLPEAERGNNRTANFFIQFMNNAPAGRAEITVVAYVGQQLLGSDNDSINVRSFVAPTKTSKSTTPAPTSTYPSFTEGPTSPASPLAPVQDKSLAASLAKGKGAPWILYVLGGVLVAAGGAILWLLFRTPRSDLVDVPAGGPQPIRPMSLGYPPQNPRPPAPPTYPTRVMPSVPPPSDPWAGSSDGPTLIQ
jgi:hypothetical protein